jgi:hypothetical protein
LPEAEIRYFEEHMAREKKTRIDTLMNVAGPILPAIPVG